MSQITTITSPFLLGFDDIEKILNQASKTANDGYPPYNVERLPANDGEREHIRIVLAVAGFMSEQLDVTVEENQLLIRGKQSDLENRQYLYRGIAARQFKRAFILAEGIEVLGAELMDGLLSIDLMRTEPQKIVRKISISTNSE